MTMPAQPVIRSYFFTPGNQERKLQRVFDFGADAIVMDLEDAVPIHEKRVARTMVRGALERREGQSGPLIVVRVNGPGSGLAEDDLIEVVRPNVFAIQLTKIRSVDQVQRLDAHIARLEEERNLPVGKIRFVFSVDSPSLVLQLPQLARSSKRNLALILGGVDFANSLGMPMSTDQFESLWARSYGVLVSSDAGLSAPIHPPFLDFNDEEGLTQVLHQGKRLGFMGAVALHPKQIAPIHRVFTPTEREIEWARLVVAEFELAEAEGRASLAVDGQFIDYAIVATAQSVLALVDRIQLGGVR
jgi:citrate lyase subunit beta/citryl-CoA lyase